MSASANELTYRISALNTSGNIINETHCTNGTSTAKVTTMYVYFPIDLTVFDDLSIFTMEAIAVD